MYTILLNLEIKFVHSTSFISLNHEATIFQTWRNNQISHLSTCDTTFQVATKLNYPEFTVCYPDFYSLFGLLNQEDHAATLDINCLMKAKSLDLLVLSRSPKQKPTSRQMESLVHGATSSVDLLLHWIYTMEIEIKSTSRGRGTYQLGCCYGMSIRQGPAPMPRPEVRAAALGLQCR
jgi:hypothetical protein